MNGDKISIKLNINYIIMLFFVTLPNGSIIDIDLDSTDKVENIIRIMDESDKIQSLGLIDHFHLWFQSDSGSRVNLMEDLNKTIGDCGITLESKIYMQTKPTTLLEIAMNISKSRSIDHLTPDFENEAEKIQKRFRGNRERKELMEQYPDTFNKKTKGWVTMRGYFSGSWARKNKHFIYGNPGGRPPGEIAYSTGKKVKKVKGASFLIDTDIKTHEDAVLQLLRNVNDEYYDDAETHISPGVNIQFLVDNLPYRVITTKYPLFEKEEDRVMFNQKLNQKFKASYPDKKTKGWITIKGACAYPGNMGPLSGLRNEPVQHSERKEIVKELGLIAYVDRNARDRIYRDNTEWWPLDQTKDPNEMLLNTITKSHSNTHISPGVDIFLLTQFMGGVIFENKEDEKQYLGIGGIPYDLEEWDEETSESSGSWDEDSDEEVGPKERAAKERERAAKERARELSERELAESHYFHYSTFKREGRAGMTPFSKLMRSKKNKPKKEKPKKKKQTQKKEKKKEKKKKKK
jgi:hypothetical protein